jgi:PTS system cellobiose-specific IIB component
MQGKGNTMLTIRLFCAAGMSTSLLVRKMEEAAAAEGTEVDIIAFPVGEMDQHLDGVDVALLGPQVGYMKAQMQKTAAAKGVPCDVIPMADYGMVNGKNVLAFAKKLANK